MPVDLSLFGRKWSLQITTYGGTQITIPNPAEWEENNGIEPNHLRITFNIDKAILRFMQIAEITIYNLNADTETELFKNAYLISLSAGYKNGAYGQIFQGYVRQKIRGKEDSASYFLKLICIDGMDPLSFGVCNFTLPAGQDARTIINQIARNSSIPFEVLIDPSFPVNGPKTPRGVTISGPAGDEMRNQALGNNAGVNHNNGKVNVYSFSSPPPAVIPELNYQTGLIGIPQQTNEGVEVTVLINPQYDLNTFVHINNRNIIQVQLETGVPILRELDRDGIYRIIGWVASGDTRGNDWYMALTTISYSGGPLPSMLSDPSQVAQ